MSPTEISLRQQVEAVTLAKNEVVREAHEYLCHLRQAQSRLKELGNDLVRLQARVEGLEAENDRLRADLTAALTGEP